MFSLALGELLPFFLLLIPLPLPKVSGNMASRRSGRYRVSVGNSTVYSSRDLGVIPSSHVTHNQLVIPVQGHMIPLLASTGTAFTWCIYMQIKHPYT